MIQVTPAAFKAIEKLCQDKKSASGGLRVGVQGGGCSGLTYTLDFSEAPSDQDHVVAVENARVFVDPRSLPFIQGMTLDYFDQQTQKGFRFKNPNATATCGCGTSFSVADLGENL